MEPIQSHANLNDAEHKANRAAMDQILADYRKILQEILKCGGSPDRRFKSIRRRRGCNLIRDSSVKGKGCLQPSCR